MELPIEIDTEVWGEVKYGEMYAPGIYWVESAVDHDDPKRGTEGFFVITKDYKGDILSKEALTYGELFGAALYFDREHGECIIDYELLRAGRKISALRKNGMEGELDKELRSKATYGMELYPEYFGEYPAPQMTPFGPASRFKKVKNGIFFVEAGTMWMLALSFPLWDDIWLDVIPLAYMSVADWAEAHTGEVPVFFKREDCAPAIFQLLFDYHIDALKPFIRLDAMIATLWARHGKFVEDYNAELDEQIEFQEESCLNSGADQEEAIQKLYDRRIPPPTVPAGDFLILPR